MFEEDLSSICMSMHAQEDLSSICMSMHAQEDLSSICMSMHAQEDLSSICLSMHAQEDLSSTCMSPSVMLVQCVLIEILSTCSTQCDVGSVCPHRAIVNLLNPV